MARLDMSEQRIKCPLRSARLFAGCARGASALRIRSAAPYLDFRRLSTFLKTADGVPDTPLALGIGIEAADRAFANLWVVAEFPRACFYIARHGELAHARSDRYQEYPEHC
jgi:hypothetical protein